MKKEQKKEKKEAVKVIASNLYKDNVYEKLANIRVVLQSKDLKKSGKNEEKNYSYFELYDFLPTLNTLMQEHGITTVFSIVEGSAILKVVNAQDPEDFTPFAIPTASVNIEGADAIQNLGGQTTYLRRYLLSIAFEIAEVDPAELPKKKTEEREKDLPKEDIKLIKETKTQVELVKVCKKLKETKGSEYGNSIQIHYQNKKEDLTKEGE